MPARLTATQIPGSPRPLLSPPKSIPMAVPTTEKRPPPVGETDESLQYWGYLFKKNKSGTERLNRLLQGIARYIAANFEPTDSPDLTPSQLAAFYRSVGGDYDILFIDKAPGAIAFIFRSLGCLYSLQPTTGDKGYTAPTIPALRPKGFVTWQTIQLLLGPEEHVPFLQNALKQYDITDPVDGTLFPKSLPVEAFPDEPDQDMLDWYDKVSERLNREAKVDQLNKERQRAFASSSDTDSADDRRGAAGYFADPLYRDRVDRPTVVRRYRPAPRSTREYVEQRGRDLMQSVRHLVIGDRRRSRRRSLPDRPNQKSPDDDDGDVTPTSPHTTQVPRRSSRQQNRSLSRDSAEESPRHSSPSPRRRRRSPIQTASSSPESRRRRPVIRQRRSHDLSASRYDSFAGRSEYPRRHSDHVAVERAGFGPSKAPPFAQHVAKVHDTSAGSGRPHISTAPSAPILPSSYRTDRPLSYTCNYTGRPTSLRYSKRGGEDSMSERERGREQARPRGGERLELHGERRRRSHSEDLRGSYDGSDEGDVGRDSSRQRMSLHRHVMVNGVSGRRYPLERSG